MKGKPFTEQLQGVAVPYRQFSQQLKSPSE